MMEEKTINNQMEEAVQSGQEQDAIVIDAVAPPPSESHQNGNTTTKAASVAIEGEIEVEAEVDPAAQDKATIAALQAELAAAEAKSADLIDKLQRTAAEFQNSRRRQEKQLADEIERAGSHIVQQLLPVIDDLELAFANVPADIAESSNAWLEGFRQIRKKLDTLLDERGVAVIAKEGPFDPVRHEAISSEPSEAVESGHIIQTLRAGYEYKGRVLRPALVRVAM